MSCKPRLEKAFDPDFEIDAATFKVEKVLKLNGFSCRYIASCDVDEMPSHSHFLDDRKLYIVKGYFFAD